MTSTIWLVTGANRGFGLVKELATNNHDVVIFAAARDPANAKDLKVLAEKYPQKIHIVRFVAADVEGNKAVAKEIKEQYGRLDVLICSAGIASYMGPVTEIPPDVFSEHFNVNVNGALVIFQAVVELLKASSAPKLVALTSTASLPPFVDHPSEYTVYGATKAALNYLIRKIHFENKWIIAWVFSPGVVRTDMAKQARMMDKTETLKIIQDAIGVSPEECAKGLIHRVVNTTREEDGGDFLALDGSKIRW